jgi:LuxR family maltose regulon positive regulatory protein
MSLGPHCSLAPKLLALGDAAGARAALAEDDEAARRPEVTPHFQAEHAAGHILFALQMGDMDVALEWYHRLSEYPGNALGFSLQHIPIRVLIATGEKEAAAKKLRDLYDTAIRGGVPGYGIRLRVCQALAAQTPEEAMSFLAEALVSGEPEGYIRTFVDEGKLLKPLLQKCLAQGVTPEYTARLLNIIEAEERQRQSRNGAAPSTTPASRLLSEREMEILRLVAEGLTNRQIAERLVISLGTAKTHVHNISEKLNAKTRTQALARARELKLI